jgi:hypothetical protein
MFRQGRQSNTRNVLSGTVKKNIQLVFDGLGGWEAMLNWARENRDVFYGSVYPKLLPTEGYDKAGNIRVLVYAPSNKPLETGQAVGEMIAEDMQVDDSIDGHTPQQGVSLTAGQGDEHDAEKS